MTLRELCKLVRGKKSKGGLKRSQLLSRHEGLIARLDMPVKDGAIRVSVKVYESGYVLYEEDDRYTVFHLDDLKDKHWNFGSVTDKDGCCNMVRNEVMMSEEWSYGLILEGNDRIMHNRDKSEADYVEFSYSGIAEDLAQLRVQYNFTKTMEDKATREQMEGVFDFLRKAMSETQWEAYVLIESLGKKEREVAEMLGMSQQAVSKNYKKACEIVLRFRARLKKDFYEN